MRKKNNTQYKKIKNLIRKDQHVKSLKKEKDQLMSDFWDLEEQIEDIVNEYKDKVSNSLSSISENLSIRTLKDLDNKDKFNYNTLVNLGKKLIKEKDHHEDKLIDIDFKLAEKSIDLVQARINALDNIIKTKSYQE